MTAPDSEAALRLHAQRLDQQALLRALTVERHHYKSPFLSAALREADIRGIDIAGSINRVLLSRENEPSKTVSISDALNILSEEWPLWHLRTIRHCFDHALVIGRERHNWILHAYAEDTYRFSFFLPNHQSVLDLVGRFLHFEESLHAIEPHYDLENWHALISVRSSRYLLHLVDRLHAAQIALTVQTPTLSKDPSGQLSLRVPRGEKKRAQRILFSLEGEVRSLYDQVQTAFKQREAARELSLYAQLVSYGLQNPVVFYNLGVALYESGRFVESSESLIEAISLWLSQDNGPIMGHKTSTGGVFGSVMGLLQKNAPTETQRALPEGIAEAEHWLTLLHQRLPQNGHILRVLAATAAIRNDTERALMLYRSLLIIQPDDAEAQSFIREQRAVEASV